VADGHRQIAYWAHLGGALFGFVYYKTHWHLFRLVPERVSFKRMFRSRPKLTIHDPEQRQAELDRKADEILKKISQQGQESLTKQEREFMEQYSRRMQQKYR
jgi:hypothetical protein